MAAPRRTRRALGFCGILYRVWERAASGSGICLGTVKTK